MKRFPFWLLCVGLFMMSGCKATGPSGPLHVIDALDAGNMGYSFAWTSDIALPDDKRLKLVETVGDLLVTVENRNNLITAVRLRDGVVQWRTAPPRGSDSIVSVGAIGNNILITTETMLHQLDSQSGKTISSVSLAQAVVQGPVLIDRFAVTGGISGLVSAQDVNNGLTRWSYQMTDFIPYQLVQQGGTIYVADRRGVLAALVGSGGMVIWRRQPTDAVTAQPMVSGDTLYVPTIENKLHAIDRSNGRDRWIYRSQERMNGTPVVLEQQVLQPLADGTWASIDASNGQEQWSIEGPFHSVQPIRQGLLFASRDRLVLVDKTTGSVLSESMSNPTFKMLSAGERLILVGLDGRIVSLQPAR